MTDTERRVTSWNLKLVKIINTDDDDSEDKETESYIETIVRNVNSQLSFYEEVLNEEAPAGFRFRIGY